MKDVLVAGLKAALREWARVTLETRKLWLDEAEEISHVGVEDPKSPLELDCLIRDTCGNLAATGCSSCGTALASALEDFLQGCCLPSVPTEQHRV